jgi:hypothetical protein
MTRKDRTVMEDKFLNAENAFKRGDFALSGKLFHDIVNTHEDKVLKEKAGSYLGKLKNDPVEILIGLASFLLLAFLFLYFGFIR